MANVTKPHGDFVNNVDVANATYVDDQFNTLYNLVNGNLDSTNVKSAAAVQGVTNPWGDNTLTNRSMALTSSSTALTLTNISTWYKLPLGNKSNDNLVEYDNTLYRFTAKHAGLYDVIASVEISNLVSGDRVAIGIFKNGSLSSYLSDITYSGLTNKISNGSDFAVMAIGDYLEIYVNSISGAAGKTVPGSPQTVYARFIQVA